MAKKFKLFGEFAKVETQEDGTLLVSGIASSEAVDGAGEVVKADAIKAAIPDYMRFANIREMHQAIAAGTALKCEVAEDGKTYLEAKIVDPTTVMKIQEGVLKGFSIGGKVTGRDSLNKAIITGIKLNEISVVDRPCNPEAVFSMGKVEADAEEARLGDLRKGLFEVASLAELIQRIGWLASYTKDEAEWEGDASPVPAKLAHCVAALGECLQEMAAEEIAELLSLLPAAPTSEVLTMAEKLAKGEAPENLRKAGARYSKTTKTALSKIHKAIKECESDLTALKYEEAEEEEESGEGEGEAKKLAKLNTEKGEALAKVQQLQEDLSKAQGEAADLRKQVDALKALPAPAKGLKVVAKGEDIVNPEEADALKKKAEEIQKLPPEEQAAALIKFIHGGR